MTTVQLAGPAGADRPGRTSRIAAIALAIVGGALLLAGACALAGNLLRDGDGFFTSPRERFSTETFGIAMKSVDLTDAPEWAFGDLGLDSVRVQAEADRPLFLGIARASDVARYLGGVDHDDVSGLTYHPFDVDYDHVEGGSPAGAPTERTFWVASATGKGPISLEWEPKPGDWRAVLMNVDGSRGVAAELRLGARTDLLRWIGAVLVVAGGLAAAAAAAFYVRSLG
jgi:hypothetical protein